MKPDFLIIPIGMAIQLIFLFKRELLTERKFEKWIWIGSAFIFIVGYYLANTYGESVKTLPILMMPIMAYGIFRIQLWIYMKLFKAEPVDTFYTMDLKLMRSGIFNFIFWVVGLIIPILISHELIK